MNWALSVALSRWRHRAAYALRSPFVYRNWWALLLPKLGYDTTLVLRNGLRYSVRGGTNDLAVVNEAAILDPYLGPGHVTLAPDATVIDAGANIGDFSIRAAAACPRGRVLAIEPVTELGQRIDLQARLNGLANVTWLPLALGGHDGDLDRGALSALYRGDSGPSHIPVTTLPTLLSTRQIARVHLLKLDCEGAEWDILPAAEPVLPAIDQICMEFHCERGWTPPRLAAWLRERGYVVVHTAGPWNGLLWAWRPGKGADLVLTSSEPGRRVERR